MEGQLINCRISKPVPMSEKHDIGTLKIGKSHDLLDAFLKYLGHIFLFIEGSFLDGNWMLSWQLSPLTNSLEIPSKPGWT